MDELVAAAATVDLADEGYAADDMGQRGAQSASAATDVAAPVVDVMAIDGAVTQGCAAAEQLEDADPKVTNASRALRLLRNSPPDTPNGGHARMPENPCCTGCGGPARPEA